MPSAKTLIPEWQKLNDQCNNKETETKMQAVMQIAGRSTVGHGSFLASTFLLYNKHIKSEKCGCVLYNFSLLHLLLLQCQRSNCPINHSIDV